MHSYGDRRTHDFFFNRDYPDVSLLDRLFGRLHTEPQPKVSEHAFFLAACNRMCFRCCCRIGAQSKCCPICRITVQVYTSSLPRCAEQRSIASAQSNSESVTVKEEVT